MKKTAKQMLSLLLALLMLCSLCVNVFAADEVALNATLSTTKITKSAEAQTVTLYVAPASTLNIAGYGFKVNVPENWSITAISNDDPNARLTATHYNLKTGEVGYQTDGVENFDISKFATVTISIPANTEAGTYSITINNVTADKDYGFTPVLTNATTASVDLVIEDTTPAADGYTVAVSGDATIQTGEEAQVKLNITHSDANETSYAAYSMKVSYNKDVLTYKSFSDTDATVTDDKSGSLTIYRYGKDLTLGQNLTLSFTGKAGGTGEVKVTEAKIDKSENALKNAPAAAVTGSATITVGQTYTVNRDTNVVDGNPKAEAGKDYTFKLANGLDGTYMDVSYTVGGVDKGTLTQGSDGSYTIPAGEITGDITITAVGKTYTVTKAGTGADDVTLNGNTATYGTNYTFTLTPEANYAYTVTVTAGGKSVTHTPGADGKTYTIDGKDITDNLTITVTKEADKAQINFTGSGSADVVNGSTSQIVEPGQDFKFSINKENGYEYTVTAAKANGTAVTVKDNGDGTYTIAGAAIAAGDVITVTVEKELIETKYTVEVNEFVKLDNARSVFLITAKLNGDAKLADGKVLAYGNNAMFQNANRYNGAYAYLVISDKSLAEVKAEAEKAGQITEVEGSAEIFNVNGDVNYTGLVDINDAQLVYNIYNAKYDSFDNTTMAMFLAADMNGSRCERCCRRCGEDPVTPSYRANTVHIVHDFPCPERGRGNTPFFGGSFMCLLRRGKRGIETNF